MKNFLKKWLLAMKDRWVTMVVACGVWMILGNLWMRGVHNVLLVILNYLTGSLLGLDGENVIGGAIGRGILLTVVNSFFASLLMHKGSMKIRMHYAKKSLTSAVQSYNDYIASMLSFKTKDVGVIICGLFGIGLSICVNTFVTGNGEFVNSFVNLALFAICVEQIHEKRGFLVACGNVVLKKFGYQEINGDWISGLLNGISLGCLVAPVTYLLPINGVSYVIGMTLLLVGVIVTIIGKMKGAKMA